MTMSGCAYLHGNFRAVEEGRFYRSGQMSPGQLRAKTIRCEIGTVINLRGANPGVDWYEAERAVCAALGAKHYDLDWSKDEWPAPESLALFVQYIEDADGPVLVHCQGGTHRSGVASAFYLLDRGVSLDEAREQLDIFFGDAPIGQALDAYEGSTLPFREWVRDEYPRRYAARVC
jgi:protein tyrosine/serine phosphatase